MAGSFSSLGATYFGQAAPSQGVTFDSGAASATASVAASVGTSASGSVTGTVSSTATVAITASGGLTGQYNATTTVPVTATASASGVTGKSTTTTVAATVALTSAGSVAGSRSASSASAVGLTATGALTVATSGSSTRTATVGLSAAGTVTVTLFATDSVYNAPDISSNGVTQSGTQPWDNSAATTESGEPVALGVWHKVFIARAGDAYFQHATAPSGDTIMSIWRGPATLTSYSDLTMVGSADDTIGNKPAINYTSPGNEWIYIASAGFGSVRYSGQSVIFTLPAPNATASMDITVTPTADFSRATVSAAVGTSADGFVFVPPQAPASLSVSTDTTATGLTSAITLGSISSMFVGTSATGLVVRDSITRVGVNLSADGAVSGHLVAGWGICLGGAADLIVDNNGRTRTAMRLTVTASGTVTAPVQAPQPGFSPVLDEQWASIDTSRWSVYNNSTFGAPQRVQRYMSYNAVTGSASSGATNGGSLKLRVQRENVGGNAFTAGMVDSKSTNTFYPRYGRYEFRAKIPHGQGLWPSFWLTAKNGGATMAEFDIVEYFHIQTPGHNSTTLHGTDETGTFHGNRYTNNGGANPRTFFEAPTYTPGWHKWVAEIVPVTDATGTTLANPNSPSHYVRYRIYLDDAATPAVSFVDTSAMYYTTNGGDADSFWNIYLQGSQVGGEYVGMPDDPLGYSTQHNGCVSGGTAPNACKITYNGQTVRRAGAAGATATFADPATTVEIDYVRVSKFTQVFTPPTTLTYDPAKFNYGAYGTYKPTATTTGIPAGSPALTVSTGGDLIITSGGTYDLVDFRRRVVVRTSDPVVFSRCIFRGNATLSSNSALLDCNDTALTGRNVKVYDSEFTPSTPSIWWDGIIGHDYEAHRCEVTATVDGFGVYNTHSPVANVELYGNWVHELSLFSPDPNHADGHTHNDCVQWQGGSSLTMVGNNFEGTVNSTIGAAPFDSAHRNTVTGAGPNNSQSGTTTFGYNANYPKMLANSAIQVTQGVGGPSTGMLCTNNWFSGGGYAINIGVSSATNYSDLGTIANNRFTHTALYGPVAIPSSSSSDITVTVSLHGNVYDDTSAAIPIFIDSGSTLNNTYSP